MSIAAAAALAASAASSNPRPGGAPGKIFFSAREQGDWNLFSIESTGAELHRVMGRPGAEGSPSWSPAGTALAFAADVGRNFEIYRAAAIGPALNLTNNTSNDYRPAFSPDGARIAFSSDRDGDAELMVMNADGTGQRPLTSNSVADAWPTWSPDGSTIAFLSKLDGDFDLYTVRVDGTGLRKIMDTPQEEGAPAWSPTGEWLAFAGPYDGDWDVYLVHSDGTGLRALTTDRASQAFPTWSPDGEHLAFVSNGDGDYELYTMRPDGSIERQLTVNDYDDSEPTWQWRSDSIVPLVKPLSAPVRAGGTAPLRFQISDSSAAGLYGWVMKGRTVVHIFSSPLQARVSGAVYSSFWNVPAKLSGSVQFCVYAIDAFFNETAQKTCTALKVLPRAKR